MNILPFDFEETCHYFKNFTDEEKAYVYGIVGGTLQYLLQMNDKLRVEDNIKNTFPNPNYSLFGKCKWTNENVGLGVLETLVKRSELFPYKNVRYYIFAKTGFTKGCSNQAKEMGMWHC